MTTERVVEREVRKEVVEPVRERVVERKTTEVEEVPVAVPVATPAPRTGSTNINVAPGRTGRNVSVNTSDGTQVVPEETQVNVNA